jgi:amidophosphoribosyltransferase
VGAGGLREACGVFGILAPGREVAPLVFDGLYALQHRGQESAGMAVSDGESITVYKDMGLVSSVFDERTLLALRGHLAIGHTRYSTAGESTWRNAQPVYRPAGAAGIALGHNGNLTNTAELADALSMLPGILGNDSDLVAELVARAYDERAGLVGALEAVLPRLEGAFSLVCMDRDTLVGVRDPNGFRPLCLGDLDGAAVLASESPALDVIGARLVREVEPGEMVVVDGDGIRSLRPFPRARLRPSLCVFEYVYFARPDALLLGHQVHGVRRRMGERLAAVAPVPADLVMGVPDGGVPAAEGYARAAGIPFGHGLVKNRYIGRTFIAPDQGERRRAVRRKLNPLVEDIAGQRLVVVDDSIVRGTTTQAMVAMLFEAGAAEVHLRISSPPYRWPCHFGIDTPDREHLLAANHGVETIREILGATSLAYLPLEALLDSVAEPGLCDACLTGNYPAPVPRAARPEGAEPAAPPVVAAHGPVVPVSVPVTIGGC